MFEEELNFYTPVPKFLNLLILCPYSLQLGAPSALGLGKATQFSSSSSTDEASLGEDFTSLLAGKDRFQPKGRQRCPDEKK